MVMCSRKSSVEPESTAEEKTLSGGMLEGIKQELGGGGNDVLLGPSTSQISVATEDVVDDDKSNNTSDSEGDGEYMPSPVGAHFED